MNNALQKAIPRFLLGAFLLHYYVQSLFLNLLERHFFFLFLFHLYQGLLRHLSFLLPEKKQVAIICGIYWWHFLYHF